MQQQEKLAIAVGYQNRSGLFGSFHNNRNNRRPEIAILVRRKHRNYLRGIRQILFKGECAVGIQRERFTADLQVGVRTGSTINDQTGFDPKEEILAVIDGIRRGLQLLRQSSARKNAAARKRTRKERFRRTRQMFQPGSHGLTGES